MWTCRVGVGLVDAFGCKLFQDIPVLVVDFVA
jgi:hypothetical protein